MSAVIVVPDGVGVRNFVLGSFLGEATAEADVHVLHAIPEEILHRLPAAANGRVHWHPLAPYQETGLGFFLRNVLVYAQMYWSDTFGMRYKRNLPITGPWRRSLVRRAARRVGRWIASPRGMRTVERWHLREVGRQAQVSRYRALFQEIRPTVVFCTHQRPFEILPPVLAARSLGIPTATFIFSWDNLTSKGRIAAPFDHYLVWSRHMRDELLRLYPDVPASSVHVVGTPQFAPYAEESLKWSRDEFFRRVGADPSRKLICYSGGDAPTCPEDPSHVRILMELIRSGRIPGRPQVMVRPTPVDDPSRYAQVVADYPEILFAPPVWARPTSGHWAAVMPLPEDIQMLANLTRHADLNVNLASTMTLDFALQGKPVVNVAFDVASPPPFGIPLWDYYYRFDHYRPVVELGAARFARSADEFAEHVNAYLRDPGLDRDARERLVRLEVEPPIAGATQRVLEALQRIASTGALRGAGSAAFGDARRNASGSSAA